MSDNQFEDYFVLSVIHSKRFRDYVIESVSPTFLQNWACQRIYEAIRRLHRRDRLVSFITVRGELALDTSISQEKLEEVIGFLGTYENNVEVLDSMVDHVLPRVEDEVGKNIVTNAIISAQNLVEADKYREVFPVFEKAKVQGTYSKQKEKRLFESIANSNGDFSIPFVVGIPLGIKGLKKGAGEDGGVAFVDEELYHKGMPRGSLAILGGSSGRGKTPFLQNVALCQALSGYNVNYYSLEVDEQYLFTRSISMLTGVPTNDLSVRSQDVNKELKNLIERYPNHQEVAYFQSRAHHMTPAMIGQDLIYSERAGRKVDVVIVDYVDLMGCDRKFKEDWQAAAYNTVELRDIGIEYSCLVLTASQLDKAASNTKIATRANVRGAFAKIFTADVFFTINWENIERTDVYGNNKPVTVVNFWLDKTRYSQANLHLQFDSDFTTGRVFDFFPRVAA